MWPLWVRLGWNDILQRYRRSMLGPFWLTASMAIMVIALGVLYAELFNTPIHDFLPYLCVGLLVWNLMSSFLTEGGTLFTGAESYIKQIRLPYSVYVFRSSWSKLIIFAHNFVIYFGVLLYFQNLARRRRAAGHSRSLACPAERCGRSRFSSAWCPPGFATSPN